MADVTGWNLPFERVELDTTGEPGIIGEAAWRWKDGRTNRMLYAIDELPECGETASNDTTGTAQAIVLPLIVNGKIEAPGDVDVFGFEGRAGDEVVVEVTSRALASPLDSVLHLIDAMGTVIAWNDDREDRRIGLNTHQADSYLRVKLPADGFYGVRLSDAQQHGGAAYAYRLRVSPPRPDFLVMSTPSALNLRAGSTKPFTVHVVRRDGFDGVIELSLKDAPEGLRLGGGRISRGRDRIQMTLSAPPRPLRAPIALTLEAHAVVDGREIRHRVVPAEDMMQAFLNRHLVPTREFLVSVAGSRVRIPPMQRLGQGPVGVPVDGSVRVLIKARGLPDLSNITFELANAPEGVSLRDVGTTPHGLLLVLSGKADPAKVGFGDNLIVEIYANPKPPKRGKGKARRQPKRTYVGVLPAIPFEFVPNRNE